MNVKDILQSQVVIGNTMEGWPIGSECKDAAKAAMDGYAPGVTKLMECGNCHIVLVDDSFEGGCPNCGNKGKFEYVVAIPMNPTK